MPTSETHCDCPAHVSAEKCQPSVVPVGCDKCRHTGPPAAPAARCPPAFGYTGNTNLSEPDILIRASRIVCPHSGIDSPGSMLICGERIDRIMSSSESQTASARVLDIPDGIVLPGLVDLHAHPACQGSVFGIDPDRHMLAHGVTTVLSQGDAGADGVDDYIAGTISASRTRVLLAINLSSVGESTSEGCFEALSNANVDACVTAIDRHREHIPAIAVNASHHACGSSDPREILQRAIEVAEQTELPLLYGMRRPEDWPLKDQLNRLRARDIVTYCFRREPHCIVENDRVLPCIRDARERGILFDVGHGMASFSFDVAAAAIGDGFLPDTISTDLQNRHVGSSPAHNLPLVMSKLHAAGMSEADVFAAVTRTPAQLIQPDAGQLMPDSPADITVLKRVEEQHLTDALGQTRTATMWVPQLVIRAGVEQQQIGNERGH